MIERYVIIMASVSEMSCLYYADNSYHNPLIFTDSRAETMILKNMNIV